MTTQNMLRGRQVVASLTNQSGGAIIAGDVVIVSAANDESFTTTTSAAYNSTRVGVALESIAAAASGRVLLEGYAPLVNVSASATRGHYLLTHTVAKQATSQAGYAAGAFGQIIKAGTTPSAMIFPVAQVGSAGVARSGATTDAHLAVWNGSNADSIKDGGAVPAGGAPTTTPYVTTAADAGLSAEVVIPGFAGSPDIAGAGGAGTSDEFDTISLAAYTWSANAPTTSDANTTIKSHWYIKQSGDSNTRTALKSWSPAGAFDARIKISVGLDDITSFFNAGFFVSDSGSHNGFLMNFGGPASGLYALLCYTLATDSFTQRGTTVSFTDNALYLRMVRDGSNNISFFYSIDGLTWRFIVTQALTATVANIGLRLSVGNNSAYYVAVDWIRTSV